MIIRSEPAIRSSLYLPNSSSKCACAAYGCGVSRMWPSSSSWQRRPRTSNGWCDSSLSGSRCLNSALPEEPWRKEWNDGEQNVRPNGPRLNSNLDVSSFYLPTFSTASPVISTLFLLSIDRALTSVHVQDHPMGGADPFHPGHQLPIEPPQTGRVLLPRQQVGLEPVQG